jgi:hypothetical protein
MLLEEEAEAEAAEEEAEAEAVLPIFEAKHKGSGRWVVLNLGTGEQMNEGYLKKAEAKALAKELAEAEEEKPSLDLGEDSD